LERNTISCPYSSVRDKRRHAERVVA